MSDLGVNAVKTALPTGNQSWIVNRIADGVREGVFDLTTLTKDEYFTDPAADSNIAYVKAGLPLGRITDTGAYGPFDPDATDGRQSAVAGILESTFEVEYGRTGLKKDEASAGIRYMGVINKKKLPVEVPDGTAFEGLFLDYDPTDYATEAKLLVSSGGGSKGDPGAAGAAGAGITALALTTDADGKVTGGKATLSDKSTIDVTVTASAA